MQVRRTLTVGATPTGLAEGQLSLGLADNPPTVWAGVPTSIDPSGRVQILPGSFVTTSALTTALGGYLPLTGGTLTGDLFGTEMTATYVWGGQVSGQTVAAAVNVVWNSESSATPGVWNYLTTGLPAAAMNVTANGNLNLVTAGVGTSGAPITWTGYISVSPAGDLNVSGDADVIGGINGTGLYSYTWLWAEEELYINGTGVVYENVGPHGFNFRWDSGGGTLYGRINNVVEVPIGTVSDERFKQDIEPSSLDCLGKLKDVPLFKFRWKEGEVSPLGFVAQRLREVFPEAVTGEMTQSVNVNTMVAALVGAVQQLAARVEELEAERG